MNDTTYHDALEQIADRGITRGADAVFDAARIQADVDGPVRLDRPSPRRIRPLAVAAALIVALLVGTAVARRGSPTQVELGTNPTPVTNPTPGTNPTRGTVRAEYRLDVVGSAPRADVDASVVTLQHRFDAAHITADVTVEPGGTSMAVRVYDDVERPRIAALTVPGVLRFRPVLVQLPPEHPTATDPVPGGDPAVTATPSPVETTRPTDDLPAAKVVLPERDAAGQEWARYSMGPVALAGAEVDHAAARTNPQTGEWEVEITFRAGASGLDRFNELARRCQQADTTCPSKQLGITLDGVVLSAPTIEPMETTFVPFPASIALVHGLTEETAGRLAALLDGGELPVRLELR